MFPVYFTRKTSEPICFEKILYTMSKNWIFPKCLVWDSIWTYKLEVYSKEKKKKEQALVKIKWNNYNE